MRKYNYRLLNIGEKKTEEEKKIDKEREKNLEKKMSKVLERIRKTEVNGKVFVEWLGRVKSF